MTQGKKNTQSPFRPLVTPWDVLGYASLPLELLLHESKTFGVRSVGGRIGGAFLLMLLFAAFHPYDNSVILIVWAIAVFPFGIFAQTSANARMRGGEELHTRYNGMPRAKQFLSRFSELTIKRLEPLIATAIGFILHRLNHPMGSFVITSAISLGIRTTAQIFTDSTQKMDLSDAIIETRRSAENLRRIMR